MVFMGQLLTLPPAMTSPEGVAVTQATSNSTESSMVLIHKGAPSLARNLPTMPLLEKMTSST